ncbi:LamG domain-containing protein, partial [Candidatus Dojkabacteria bacterium]|nr:LamG domain-containing protein [Candidatus Dojkabacteria bacterium]
VGAIELWFKLLAPPKSGYNHILDKDSSYGISIYNGQLCAFLNPIGWNCATENLEINKWYHTVLTYDGTVENIFLNNKKIFEKSITSTIGASGYNLAIGARQDGTIAFNGIIDTVRIYNRALTSSEVLSNYNSNAVKYAIRGGNSNNPNDGTWSEWKDNTTKSTLRSFDNTSLYESEEDGLVGYWSMDEESGTTVNDVSGTGNNGTATGTSIVDGRYGKGRSFNGSSDYVTLPSGFNDFTTGMTINLWAKPTVEEASYSTTGLVGQWNFNETSGTVASSGGSCSTECYGTLTDFADTTGQDKVIGSGWTYDNRKNGQGALMFDGSDDVVGLADSDKANITGDISIEFWVNLNNSQNHTVVHKGQQYSILIKSNNTISWADSSYWSYDDFGYHNIGLEIDKWQHIAVTKSNGIVKIYLNGVEKVSKSFGSALTSNTGIMYFGCYRELTTNVCRNGTYLNGTLDTVRIYNRALTAQEVLSNYTAEETLSTINTRFVNLAESEEQDNSNIVFDRWGETDTLRLEVGNGT